MGPLTGIRGLLIDVDGTLLVREQPVAGAAEAIAALRGRGFALRLTTNTTRRSRASVAGVLREAGFGVDDDEVLAPSFLARRRILESDRPTALLLVTEDARRDFAGVREEQDPGFVVVGDLGAGFTFDVLNAAFRALRKGARLLALHRGRCWMSRTGLVLDVGAFVAALEYGAQAKAECVGKPEAAFFELALGEIGLPPNAVAVVGDDPRNDGAAGREAGCRTVLVRTGTYDGREAVEADLILDSLAGLPGTLGGADVGAR